MKRITKQLPGWLTLSYQFTHEGEDVTLSDVSIFRFRPKSKHESGRRLTKIIGKQFEKMNRPVELQLMPNKDFCPEYPEGIDFAVTATQ